ncbi:PAS domain-containing protein [Methylobacterium sp. P31]
MLDPGTGILKLLAWRGFHPDAAAFWDRVDADSASTCGEALKTGRRILVSDVERCAFMAGTQDLEAYRRSNLRAVQSTPLMSRTGRALGMVSTHWRECHEPSVDDFRRFDVLPRQAADLIERAQTAAALRESEERFRQFGEASSDVLWIRDAETLQWTYLTPAFETIYGIDRETALSGDNMTGWLDRILPEDRQMILGNIERVRAGAGASLEYRIRRDNDDEVRWLRDTGFPMRDTAGEVQWIGGVGRDITEEKASAHRQQVLVNELQHQARNLLGIVAALADRTVRQGGSVEAFEERLQALSRAQGLLSEGAATPSRSARWSGPNWRRMRTVRSTESKWAARRYSCGRGSCRTSRWPCTS